MTCCRELPDHLTVNTGRDEVWPETAATVEPRKLGRDVDLWQCTVCGALYEWSDHPQMYGSGNNDEEQLQRLEPNATVLVEQLLQGEEVLTPFSAACAQLSSGLLGVLLNHLQRTRVDQYERLIPQFVERLLRTKDHAMYSRLLSFAKSPHGPLVARLLREGAPLEPGPSKFLLERCEAELP